MRRKRAAGAAAMAALVFAGISAGSATAKATFHIAESESGPAVAPGTFVESGVEVAIGSEGCDLTDAGMVVTNGPKKSTISGGALSGECSSGDSATGTISAVQLSLKEGHGLETMKFKPKLAVQIAGACVYEYSKASGSFAFPGYVVASTKAVGKLRKKSAAACAPTQETTLVLSERDLEATAFWAGP